MTVTSHVNNQGCYATCSIGVVTAAPLLFFFFLFARQAGSQLRILAQKANCDQNGTELEKLLSAFPPFVTVKAWEFHRRSPPGLIFRFF